MPAPLTFTNFAALHSRAGTPFHVQGRTRSALVAWVRACAVVGLTLVAVLLPARPTYAADAPSTLLHVVDYIAADYSAAVHEGRVTSADEYKEMQEFAAQAVSLAQSLPEQPRKVELLQEAGTLKALVSQAATANAVTAAAARLHQTLIQAFQIQSVPRIAPVLRSAPPVYQRECSSCHGLTGFGDGTASHNMDPPPANFHDRARMSRRSVFSLYNTVTQGVSGTAMAPFPTLTEADRWTLALYISNFGTFPAELQEGEATWRRDSGWKQVFARAETLFASSPEEVRTQFGQKGVAVQAFLRAHPDMLVSPNAGDPIVFARAAIESARQAYDSGDHARARQLAMQAYLEGFELVESRLSILDSGLMRETERAMMALRQQIDAGETGTIDSQATAVGQLLGRAHASLERGPSSAVTSFLSAFLILTREGLEGLLVVAGIVAVLIRANRRDALPYVHVGWVSACVLGLMTWMAAMYLVTVSGASRELTEGVSALVASLMLVYVGYWLHRRSAAGAWQRFIRDHMDSALARRSLWMMAGLAFVSVYRELFETVLFYQALWIEAADGARAAVLGGFAVAALTLFVIGYALLKYGVRLPLRAFFATTAGLLCALAIVMAGDGTNALQEAGALASTPIELPTVSWLGVFPTLQGLLAQLMIGAVIAVVLRSARRRETARF